MKKTTLYALLLAFLLLPIALAAQTTGTVAVATTITAVAGTDPATQLTCVGTPTVTSSVSNMHMVCSAAGKTLHTSDNQVVAAGSVTISVQSGSNTVTWLLTKGNPIPDQWQVTANGVSKSGSF